MFLSTPLQHSYNLISVQTDSPVSEVLAFRDSDFSNTEF